MLHIKRRALNHWWSSKNPFFKVFKIELWPKNLVKIHFSAVWQVFTIFFAINRKLLDILIGFWFDHRASFHVQHYNRANPYLNNGMIHNYWDCWLCYIKGIQFIWAWLSGLLLIYFTLQYITKLSLISVLWIRIRIRSNSNPYHLVGFGSASWRRKRIWVA